MCVDIYLLVIAIVSLHLVAIFIYFFNINAHYFVTVSETTYLSYVCTDVGFLGAVK